MGREYEGPEEAYEMREEMERLEEEEEIPEVEWAEDIKRIEDPKMRQEEIEAADEILSREKILNERREAGEITEDQYFNERDVELKRRKRGAAVGAFLKSKGNNSLEFNRVFEGWDKPEEDSLVRIRKEMDLDLVKDSIGEEAFEELAERTVEGEKLGKDIDAKLMEKMTSRKGK